MPTIRYRLESPSLRGLPERVRQEYGPDARVVATEESLVGGVAGFFARRVIDVTVDLPDPGAPLEAHAFDAQARFGIARLLDDADAVEAYPGPSASAMPPTTLAGSTSGTDAGPIPHYSQVSSTPTSSVSTQTPDFASVLHGLTDVAPSPSQAAPGQFAAGQIPSGRGAQPTTARTGPAFTAPIFTAPNTILAHPSGPVLTSPIALPARRAQPDEKGSEPAGARAGGPRGSQRAVPSTDSSVKRAPEARATAPAVLSGAGDLIIVAGLGDDPVEVAHALSRRIRRAYVCDGGAVTGNTRRRVEDRRTAAAARAHGVQSGSPVVVSYGLGGGDAADGFIAALAAISADQIWIVVDASRKSEDTERWVANLAGTVPVHALATIGTGRTASPETVLDLGLPEGWSDRVG